MTKSGKMNWKRIAGLIAGIALLVVVILKLKSNKEIATDRIYHYDKEQAISVQAQTVKKELPVHRLTFPGNFEANREAKVSAESQGKVVQVFADVGQYVSRGQAVVQLDKSLLELQLKTVNIQIEELQADLDRYTKLAQADAVQGVKLEKVTLGLRSAKVQKETILEKINRTTVRAPFGGVVTMKFTEVGEFAAPGVPLIQVTDIGILKFTINVSEGELGLFQEGMTYEITPDIFPEKSMVGKVSLIGSKANRGGSYPVQFTVGNLDNLAVKAGMFGEVIHSTTIGEKGIIIPASAIVGDAQEPKVYLVKDGKARLQMISIAERIENQAVIASGIREGDTLVTNGFVNLFDGANVALIQI